MVRPRPPEGRLHGRDEETLLVGRQLPPKNGRKDLAEAAVAGDGGDGNRWRICGVPVCSNGENPALPSKRHAKETAYGGPAEESHAGNVAETKVKRNAASPRGRTSTPPSSKRHRSG
mgnify:CR=1 FL=1